MDLAGLESVEEGGVDLLEFCWPFVAEDPDEVKTYIYYVFMKRPAGLLLCMPTGFLPEEELV